MILNKSAMERGLAHASLYKTETVNLQEDKGARSYFAPEPHDAKSRVSVWSEVWGMGAGHRTVGASQVVEGGTQRTYISCRRASGFALLLGTLPRSSSWILWSPLPPPPTRQALSPLAFHTYPRLHPRPCWRTARPPRAPSGSASRRTCPRPPPAPPYSRAPWFRSQTTATATASSTTGCLQWAPSFGQGRCAAVGLRRCLLLIVYLLR